MRRKCKKAKKFGSATARVDREFPAIEAARRFFYGVMFYAAVKAYQSFKREKSVEERIDKKEHGPQESSRKGVDHPKIRHYAEARRRAA